MLRWTLGYLCLFPFWFSQCVCPAVILNLFQKDWFWSWSSNTLTTWCEESTYWKRPWCWERLRVGGEGGHRGLDVWKPSPTQWTWAWANSGRERTGKPGVLQSLGSQRVRHDLVTKQQQEALWASLLPLAKDSLIDKNHILLID